MIGGETLQVAWLEGVRYKSMQGAMYILLSEGL